MITYLTFDGCCYCLGLLVCFPRISFGAQVDVLDARARRVRRDLVIPCKEMNGGRQTTSLLS